MFLNGMTADEDPELKRLRMEKLQKMLKQKQQADAQANRKILSVEDKKDMLMNVLLHPQALNYLNQIKNRDKAIYQKIRQNLFPPQVMRELDLLMAYYSRGMIRQGVVSLTEIRVLERQALGIGSSITVKKQGEEAKNLGDFLKEEE